MSTSAGPKTLYDKIWDKHVVRENEDGTSLIYIDRHLVHEVTSPQAFEGLALAGRKVRRPDLTLAVPDHNVPTSDARAVLPAGPVQVETLMENCANNDVPVYGMNDPRQGIVHIIGPEQGLPCPAPLLSVAISTPRPTAPSARWPRYRHQPGRARARHPDAGAGQVQEHADPDQRPAGHRHHRQGSDPRHHRPIGTAGAPATSWNTPVTIRSLSVEGRMTICNMSIEGGARAGLIAPDEKTFEFFKGRPLARWYELGQAVPTGRRCRPTLALTTTRP